MFSFEFTVEYTAQTKELALIPMLLQSDKDALTFEIVKQDKSFTVRVLAS